MNNKASIRTKRSAYLEDVVAYLVYREAASSMKPEFEISERAILKSLYALRENLKSLDINLHFEDPEGNLIHSEKGMIAIWNNVPYGYDSNWRYGIGSVFYVSSRKGQVGLDIIGENLDDKSVKTLEEMSIKFHAMNKLRRN